MLFAVYLSDRPDRQEARGKYLQAHINWLKKHGDLVLVGGSLRESIDENAIGGLWIVEAETKSEVKTLIQSDPFWINGLRQEYKILHWSKAFEDQKVPI